MDTSDKSERGDKTRSALIAAAIDVFGHAGFDAASTRVLARRAGVNQALIGYHFGGKQGLYLAVFEHIISQMGGHMAPVAEDITRQLSALPEDASARRQVSLQLLLTLCEAFIDMFGDAAARHWVPLVLREQQDPTAAFALIYDGFMSRMLALASRLVAQVSGLDPASEACRIRTLMILGQMLVFRVARGTTANFMSWEAITPQDTANIKAQFRQSLESQFSQRDPIP